MNNTRRKSIQSVLDRINQIKDLLIDIRLDVEDLRSQEEDAFNNLPESMQDSERGNAMSDALESLEKAGYALMDDTALDLDSATNYLEKAAE